jgi:hypothetical protein
MTVLLVRHRRGRLVAAKEDIGRRRRFVTLPRSRVAVAARVTRDALHAMDANEDAREGVDQLAATRSAEGAIANAFHESPRCEIFCRSDDARMHVKASTHLSTKGCGERFYTSRATCRGRRDGRIRSKYVPCYDKILHHIL